MLQLLLFILVSRCGSIHLVHCAIECKQLVVEIVSKLLNVFHHIRLLGLVADWASPIWCLIQIEHLLLQLSEVMVVDVAPLAVC